MTIPDPHTLDRIIAWLEPWGPDTPHHEAAQALKALRAENERMVGLMPTAEPITMSLSLDTSAAEAQIHRLLKELRFNGGIISVEAADGVPHLGGDDAKAFDSADYYWRTMDPDDAGDTPEEATRHVGDLCVCEIASSFNGPTRYGFTSPTLNPDDDETEFLHFASHEEALAAAIERKEKLAEIAASRAVKGEEDND